MWIQTKHQDFTIIYTTSRFHDYLHNWTFSQDIFLHWPSLVRKQKWLIEIRKGFIHKHFTSTFEWTKKRCWWKVLTVLIHIFLYDNDTSFLIWPKSWPHCQDIGASYKRHIYQNQYNTIQCSCIFKLIYTWKCSCTGIFSLSELYTSHNVL